ncbi:hypothetical protein [Paenibacillus sp. GP183]|uniref:hypothetical protein n=1 Tax=Paenibacillus sp. GP183 TaxID=1882751 RepID=UPI000899819C|nr:hypothetical protein [Paenibacillus sp. GP183]SEC59017.1 hypothetical protein SAMN05443246_4627 [Paenibacillus sp. GP183]
MTLLKDSEDADKLRLVHSEIWTKLQDQDDLYAKTFLDNCLKSCEKKRVKYTISETIKDYIKSPIIWISILIEVLIVPVFSLAFIGISLILE